MAPYVQSRTTEFSVGQGVSAPTPMQAAVGFQPLSVLNQFYESGNGLGQSDQYRRTIGMGAPLLPTRNGRALDTYQTQIATQPLRNVSGM